MTLCPPDFFALVSRRRAARRLFLLARGIVLFALAAPSVGRVRAQAAADVPSDPPAVVVDTSLFDESVRALAAGVPQVAAFKLRAYLHLALPPAQRRSAAVMLVRALLAQSEGEKAAAVCNAEFSSDSDAQPADPEVCFWRGQAAAATGHWEEALAAYQRAASSPAASTPEDLWRAAARFGAADCLAALGKQTAAGEVYAELRDDPRLGETARLRCAEIALDQGRLKDVAAFLAPESATTRAVSALKERAWLVGRLQLAQHLPQLAEHSFRQALEPPEGLSERLIVDLYWGWAQARIDQGHVDTAEDVLESLLERYPRSFFLRRTFAWLEALYFSDPRADLADLRRWTEDTSESNRQVLALLTLARVQAHQDETGLADETFARLVDQFPDHPIHARALLDLAALRLRLGRPAEARTLLEQARPQIATLAAEASANGPLGRNEAGGSATGRPTSTATARATSPVAWRTEIDVLEARISLAEHDRAKAAAGFAAVAARLKEGPQAEAAAFDSVLCWLRALDSDRFAAGEEAFRARFPESPLNAEFPLEEGLARAREAQPGDRVARQQAVACLRSFLRDHPAHPRAPVARIALAELAYQRPRPELPIAWEELAAPEFHPVSNETVHPAPDEDRARAEYLAIWLADAAGPQQDHEKAIALAKKFLLDRPGTPLAAEVRMKLGEIYFQRADFSDAETQLELLAENAPTSPLAESALYLAGMAAASSMSQGGLDKAVSLFEAAARRNGPLRLTARLRQADVQNQLNHPDDARLLYEIVIKSTDNVAELSDADLEARCAALSGRGRTLLLLGESDPKLYGEAARTFDQLRNTQGASLLWRRQALTQKGHALEKMGEVDAALAAYDDALNAPELSPILGAGLNAPEIPEWTWFYRAGRDAARLLEARAQWPAAIAIYKKLAEADGPMKTEFEDMLNRQRLEHFIWDD